MWSDNNKSIRYRRKMFDRNLTCRYIISLFYWCPLKNILAKAASDAVFRKMNKLGTGIIHAQKSRNSGVYTVVPHQIPSTSGTFIKGWWSVKRCQLTHYSFGGKADAGNFPSLAVLVRQYLCTPATSVQCEGLFSVTRRFVVKNHSRLTDDHVRPVSERFLTRKFRLGRLVIYS